MEELDVTSAWILSNFITISTMTMNMKWTCPEKTISLPPSQAITPLFPTRTVVKIRHSHSMIIFFFFWAHHFPSAPGQFLRVLVIFRVETGVGHLVEQPWTVEGGGFGVPLWFGKEGCQDWWDSPLPQTKTQTQTQTHTHTHTELEGGFIWNEQTDCQVRLWTSEAFQSAGCIPCVLRSEGRIWPQN